MGVETAADVIIIGAGPCAVSAAFPLLEAGMKVLMIDAGEEEIPQQSERPDKLYEARTGQSEAWSWLLGKNGLTHDPLVSPKLRLLQPSGARTAYEQAQSLKLENFIANGRYGAGGLSRYWGAATPTLTTQELADMGLPADDMMRSYKNVMQRIGVSGDKENNAQYEDSLMPLLRLDASSQQLFDRYQRCKDSLRMKISRPWQAVLSQEHKGRGACTYSGACLWGCSKKAIYDAHYEIEALKAYTHFTFVPGHRATHIAQRGSGYEVSIHQSAATFSAPKVILAAGVITSTSLVLDLLGHYNRPIRIENAPAFAVACWDPRRLADALPKEFFALAQLHMKYSMPNNDYAWGTLYNAYGLAASDLLADFSFTMGAARRIMHQLMPSLLMGFFYLSGRYSNNTLELHKEGVRRVIHIQGNVSQECAPQRKAAIRGIKKDLLKLGLIPLQTRFYKPGGESHIGASLPIGQWTDANGQLKTHPGLYVADTASLPIMPAKHPTLTAMANADRIARSLI